MEKISDFFPKTTKKCHSVSSIFFKCLSDESLTNCSSSEPLSDDEVLIKCKKQLLDYNNCIKNDKTIKPKELYRVYLNIFFK